MLGSTWARTYSGATEVSTARVALDAKSVGAAARAFWHTEWSEIIGHRHAALSYVFALLVTDFSP